jgi:hypothetical protein
LVVQPLHSHGHGYSRLLNLHKVDDCLGMPRSYFLKTDGTPYKIFTPYSRETQNERIFGMLRNWYENDYIE